MGVVDYVLPWWIQDMQDSSLDMYTPPITRSDPAETSAKVQVEKTRRKVDILQLIIHSWWGSPSTS